LGVRSAARQQKHSNGQHPLHRDLLSRLETPRAYGAVILGSVIYITLKR